MTDDKGPMIIAVCWVFTGLALLFVSGRLYVRAFLHHKLSSDDYLIIFSSVCPHFLPFCHLLRSKLDKPWAGAYALKDMCCPLKCFGYQVSLLG